MIFYSPSASLDAAMPLEAMRAYPVKGGSLDHFDPERMPAASVSKTVRLIPWRGATLAEWDEKSRDVTFTHHWRIASGEFPNGLTHYADIYGADDE